MQFHPMRAALALIVLFLAAVSTLPVASGGNDNAASSSKAGADAAAEVAAEDPLERALAKIQTQRKAIQDLEQRAANAEGLAKLAYDARLDKAWLDLFEEGVDFAGLVAKQDEAAADIAQSRQQAVDILGSHAEVARAVVGRLNSRIRVPEAELSAAEQAAAYTRLFAVLESVHRAYEVSVKSLELSRQFGLDVAAQEALLREQLADRAAQGSVLIEMATNDVAALRASVSAVPDDAELKAKVNVASDYVRNLALGLSAVLDVMDELEMDTASYHKQVLSATGEITTDVFDVSVFSDLLLGWGQSIWNVVIEDGPDLIFKLLLFVVIVYAFHKLSRVVEKMVAGALARSQLNLSELLRRMVISIVRNVIMILGILVALSQMGVSLGPLLAGVGVVGFIVGFALQDSLSNFASGVMILIYRPFDVGDVVEAAGVTGKVSHMSLVNTTVMTFDNQTIVLPNNKIWGDVIRNVTAQTLRRVDLVFGVSYSDDVAKTEQVLQEIVTSHDKVLDDPPPVVKLHELADSSVNFIVRPWVNKDDYWDVYWDITRAVKMRFDEEGISIPFPQRDVHLYPQSPASDMVGGG